MNSTGHELGFGTPPACEFSQGFFIGDVSLVAAGFNQHFRQASRVEQPEVNTLPREGVDYMGGITDQDGAGSGVTVTEPHGERERSSLSAGRRKAI